MEFGRRPAPSTLLAPSVKATERPRRQPSVSLPVPLPAPGGVDLAGLERQARAEPGGPAPRARAAREAELALRSRLPGSGGGPRVAFRGLPCLRAELAGRGRLWGGQSKLIFKPDLTLEEVQAENPQVSRGRYCPEECKALQRVAILVPHRNREKHLMYLLEHLHPFLQRQQLDYGIYVIHQAGGKKFNRAKLLNVGYLEALKEENWDCFIFHDVDLVPENDFNLYKCEDNPKHLVVGRNSTGYRLRYSGYFGGVTALSREQFFKVNGFSNNYWGWGGEDDDLRLRVELHRMKISRPLPEVGKYTMIFHTRDRGNEVNGERMKLLHQVSRVWRTDGLSSCSYKLLSVEYNPLYVNITVDFWSGV
ncbi:beta-1,4-galactosyltransferase 4 isoform X1 [Callithrix jacchus]